LDALVGSKEQKMMVAFNCYDLDRDGTVTIEEVKFLLRHIPFSSDPHHGLSTGNISEKDGIVI
jgi:Ca2+-binding EF-hand superfamily protein